MTGPLTIFDKPNSYIGKSVPRPDAHRLLQGRGKFVDDIQLPRMVHAAFVRSPVAHGRIQCRLTWLTAWAVAGVVAVYHGQRILRGVVEPYVGVLSHLAGLRSAPQMPLGGGRGALDGGAGGDGGGASSRAVAEDAAAAGGDGHRGVGRPRRTWSVRIGRR